MPFIEHVLGNRGQSPEFQNFETMRKDFPLKPNVPAIAVAVREVPELAAKTTPELITWARTAGIKFMPINDRMSALAVLLGLRRW